MRSKRLSDPHSDNEDDASSTQEESDDGHDGSPDSAIDRPTAADDQRYENVNVLNSLNRRAPQPGAEQMPVESLDGDWLKYIDDVTQRAFFFHTPTRFASWKPPRGIVGFINWLMVHKITFLCRSVHAKYPKWWTVRRRIRQPIRSWPTTTRRRWRLIRANHNRRVHR